MVSTVQYNSRLSAIFRAKRQYDHLLIALRGHHFATFNNVNNFSFIIAKPKSNLLLICSKYKGSGFLAEIYNIYPGTCSNTGKF